MSAFSSSRKRLHTMTITMPLHCFTLLLVLTAVSICLSAADTKPQIPTMNNQSRNISPLVVELMNRMEEMERRHGNEVNILHRRIEALENFHASDLQQMSIHNKKINTLENRVKFLNDFAIKHIGKQGHRPLRGPKHAKAEHSFDAKSGSDGNGSLIGYNKVTENTHRKGSTINIHPGVRSHQSRITRVGSSQNTGIGFHAILDHIVENPGLGQLIAFHSVITNLGNAYSPNSGIFRCTQTGLYVFTSTLSFATHEKVDVQIQRNGNMISKVTCGSDDHWSSCTGTAVVQLAQGDEVWVAMTKKHQAGSHMEPSFSSFSGFLLPWSESH
ncbi:complement C1q tumor necrosis factor-related protein 3-like [Mizuhopecten yessoensis]|uniref:Caprin-2 n=1 Tax=Mizuhopecten yessoensis TaxID=6573 RepID=A0A210PLK2_MIZYE|nr:complement C1q tumor necrosis factor-related protein 3-like [Mizuhopecten yessoensis]OWF37363.1 Caprin-2 [Mizuhopecten yessoensis]